MLTTMDAIVLVLLLGLGIWGALRGFVTEILSLFAWAAAIFALKLLHQPATRLLQAHLVSGWGAAAVLAFVLVFLGVYLAGRLVAGALGRRTRQSVLGPLDRLLGAGFGALKGLLVATVLFLGANLLIDLARGQAGTRPDWMRQSRTYPLLNASGRAVVDWVRARRGPPPADADAGGRTGDAGGNRT